MPLDLATLRNDKAFDALTAAILDRDQPRTADLFYKMVTDEGRSVGEALSVVTAAEAPFVQVPNHINVKDGQVVLVNNDHTILGLRTSADLAPYLPEQYRLLPMLQSVWYIPAGLDIWNQLLGKYPGRYATMKGMNVPPPDYGPVVWNQDVAPLREGGTLDERLNAHMLATMGGQVERSYGMFLDLAADETARERLRDQLLFLGLIDVQDTIVGRKARNTGHKALRARAIVGLADYVGWERAHGVFYTGVPDMAVGPLYYSLYDYICVQLTNAFPDLGTQPRADQQDTADAARGRGVRRHADDRRSGHRLRPDHRASEERQINSFPWRYDPARRRRTDPAQHRAARVHRRAASVRLLQHRQLLVAHQQQPVSAAHPLYDGEFRQRFGAVRTSGASR